MSVESVIEELTVNVFDVADEDDKEKDAVEEAMEDVETLFGMYSVNKIHTYHCNTTLHRQHALMFMPPSTGKHVQVSKHR